ncbi:hypothetical protein [Rathayibacter soli]|uniref:hypothetical protein n=1 Tax=Rathayibacter soli TaxID=3144168 RepID=UPI0027E5B886|nr:hypothetical protein [Glaciibacter superstes]
MNEPQVWTVICVFAASLIGMVTIVSTLFIHVLRSEIGRLETNVDDRFDSLDRNLQALMRRTFGIDRG